MAPQTPRNNSITIPAFVAPDSPRASQSPPPSGIQGDLEMELLGLATALYNLGTTVINDSTKEKDLQGGAKQVGMRVNEVVGHLATIDDMGQHTQAQIPMQVLADIDQSRNPMNLTRERLERAATENQFMNGKIAAIASYRTYLDEALAQSFPEIAEQLQAQATGGPGPGLLPPSSITTSGDLHMNGTGPSATGS